MFKEILTAIWHGVKYAFRSWPGLPQVIPDLPEIIEEQSIITPPTLTQQEILNENQREYMKGNHW